MRRRGTRAGTSSGRRCAGCCDHGRRGGRRRRRPAAKRRRRLPPAGSPASTPPELPAQPHDLAHQQVEVLAAAAVVGHGHVQVLAAVDGRDRRHRDAALLQLKLDLLVELVQRGVVRPARHPRPPRRPPAHVAEADDVQLRRQRLLELGRGRDQALEVPGLVDVLLDHARELLRAVLLERHPHLERVEPARELEPEVREPRHVDRRQPAVPLPVRQIRRRERERVQLRLRVADQHAPDAGT